MIAGAGLAAPSLFGQSGCATALIPKDAITGLSLGYVSGDVTSSDALIWLRADPGSQVSIQYSKDPRFPTYLSTAEYPVSPDNDFTAIMSLEEFERWCVEQRVN